MRFSYLTKVKAVGRLPFLLSIVETRAKNKGTKRTEIGTNCEDCLLGDNLGDSHAIPNFGLSRKRKQNSV